MTVTALLLTLCALIAAGDLLLCWRIRAVHLLRAELVQADFDMLRDDTTGELT